MAKLEKAKITPIIPAGSEISVQINPKEYSLSESNRFSEVNIPGLRAPMLQFVQGQIGTLSMELFFDSYEEKTDVREKTRKVANLMKINEHIHAPPVLLFQWGSLDFTCVLERVEQTFILFLPDGRPARAKLRVTFKEFINAKPFPDDPNQSSTFDKIYIVQTGDTLAGIAAQVYEDPRLWRHIAENNDIDNPKLLAPGQVLAVPPLS